MPLRAAWIDYILCQLTVGEKVLSLRFSKPAAYTSGQLEGGGIQHIPELSILQNLDRHGRTCVAVVFVVYETCGERSDLLLDSVMLTVGQNVLTRRRLVSKTILKVNVARSELQEPQGS